MPNERRNGTTAGIRREEKTRIWGLSQRARSRGTSSKIASQSMTLALETFSAPTRKTSKDDGKSELKTYKTREKHQKKNANSKYK